MVNIKSPCYNCQNRQIGCHGKCQSYLAYQAKNNAVNAKRREEQEKAHMINDCYSKYTTAVMYIGW